MLSFATEFPLDRSRQPNEFLDVVRTWILASPHTDLVPDDLADIPEAGEWSVQRGNDSLRMLMVSTSGDDSAAIRWKRLNGRLEWDTTIIYSRQASDAWVGIRTSRESDEIAIRLPPAKKPVLVQQLMRSLGGAADGELMVFDEPHLLASDQVMLAMRLIAGKAGCRLPVVYLSRGFRGEYIADANSMAVDLAGMAHVVVEPSRVFSRQLQIEVLSENVYGGAIGVYWPNGGGRRSIFIGHEFDNPRDIKRAVIDEVRIALINRRPLARCTWSAVQDAVSQQAHAALKASGSKEIEQYIELFDADIATKKQQLLDAEAEIARLEDEVKKAEWQAAVGTVRLFTAPERDMYEGEILQIVRDALDASVKQVVNDSRREHVLKAILKSMSISSAASEQKEALKDILREYKSMSSRTRKDLEEIGFLIEDDGKHHKLTYQDDDRYTFSLPKSGSDHRGGLNAASDISKRLF
jgi:hypothetical protein